MRPTGGGSSVNARRMMAVAVATTVAAVLVQCTPAPPPAPVVPSSPSRVPSTPQPTPPTTPPPAPAIQPVSTADLGATWRPGCPVGAEQLRRVEVEYLGFDNQLHRGPLIVHEDLATEVAAIFEQLLALRYPIEKIRTVADYPGADDELSMEDNNTSAFNCREIPGTGRWAEHAFGRAIDLNPLINPSISSAGVLEPKTAGPYLDRNRIDPGLLHAGDPAVRVFLDRGWQWGGNWRNPHDYQHFER